MAASSSNLGITETTPSDYRPVLIYLDSSPARGRLSRTDPPIPRIDGFEIFCQMEYMHQLRPLEVYQTGIQMLYEFAQRPWIELVYVADSKKFLNYDVLILFINSQPPTRPNQLQVKHCVASLYRAISIMTDGVMFYQLRCHVSVMKDELGALSITPWDDVPVASGNASKIALTRQVDGISNNASIDRLTSNSGQFRDPDNPSFVMNYHFFGKAINSKSVSMAVVEAMTMAAPFPVSGRCKELSVVSPDGACAIFIESISSHHEFTYRWATRALKNLYQHIIVAQKRFGDIYIELWFDAEGMFEQFGELRMLKFAGSESPRKMVVADER